MATATCTTYSNNTHSMRITMATSRETATMMLLNTKIFRIKKQTTTVGTNMTHRATDHRTSNQRNRMKSYLRALMPSTWSVELSSGFEKRNISIWKTNYWWRGGNIGRKKRLGCWYISVFEHWPLRGQTPVGGLLFVHYSVCPPWPSLSNPSPRTLFPALKLHSQPHSDLSHNPWCPNDDWNNSASTKKILTSHSRIAHGQRYPMLCLEWSNEEEAWEQSSSHNGLMSYKTRGISRHPARHISGLRWLI